MPLLDRWLEGILPKKPLADATALFIQHQFGNQVPQARALLELGLAPERVFWIDVPYTSNARVRDALEGLGIPRENLIVSHDYHLLDAYAPYQRRRVQFQIRRFLDDPPGRLLVLDDGAYFLEAAACFKRKLPHAAIVEQTTRGLIKMESNAAMRRIARDFPIVNVARSAPKKTLEPPFIGQAVCRHLETSLKGFLPAAAGRRCLILGFGAIGSQVARFSAESLGFEPGCIHVYDPDPVRLDAARSQGFAKWDREDLETRFHLVVGCSGRSSFTAHDYVYLEDGAVLASASSGTVELSREGFIELADSSDLDDIAVDRRGLDPTDVHSDLRFQLVDREAVFLNGGFPVNFDGSVNCIPTRYMQPTATMMTAAAVQTVSSSCTGLVELEKGFCSWLDRQFRVELGGEAEHWLPPPCPARKVPIR